MLDLKKLTKSFYYAGRGLGFVFKDEQNFRLEVFFSAAIIILMYLLGIENVKIILVGFLLSAILVVEIINTIIEEVTDFLGKIDHVLLEKQWSTGDKTAEHSHSLRNDAIGRIKDLSAAAVLITGLLSIFFALAIFFKI